jgi:hypothetical protein
MWERVNMVVVCLVVVYHHHQLVVEGMVAVFHALLNYGLAMGMGNWAAGRLNVWIKA